MSSTPSLTPDQIDQLRRLGISVPASTPTVSTPPSAPEVVPVSTPVPLPSEPVSTPASTPETNPPPSAPVDDKITPESISESTTNLSDGIKEDQTLPLTTGEIPIEVSPSNPSDSLLTTTVSPQNSDKKPASLLPVFSISGLTLLSFGGLVLLKSKVTSSVSPSPVSPPSATEPGVSPTQVPKSIQHYLLASQQYFSQALQIQQTAQSSSVTPDQSQLASTLNQSIIIASQAIQEFPDDYRGYQQRGTIYQSLIGSQPQYLDTAIADFSKAVQLNPGSADLTHSLATLYAQKGDAANTLAYLNRTVAIDPTKAQNFYDLARIQQQAGQITQAIDTYNRLLTIVADPSQKTEVESDLDSLKRLITQNPSQNQVTPTSAPTSNPIFQTASPNLIQASADSGLVIAAPAANAGVDVSSLSSSNALSGTAYLIAGEKQITITNSNLTPSSQVYVSIVSGGKNQNLQVLSRDGQNFTAGFDSPIKENVSFNWWIVNP